MSTPHFRIGWQLLLSLIVGWSSLIGSILAIAQCVRIGGEPDSLRICDQCRLVVGQNRLHARNAGNHMRPVLNV